MSESETAAVHRALILAIARAAKALEEAVQAETDFLNFGPVEFFPRLPAPPASVSCFADPTSGPGLWLAALAAELKEEAWP